MTVGEQISVIIPSYNPNEKLIETVRALRSIGFCDIIIVNDGSDEAHLRHFPDKYEPCCTVINMELNRGKGAALKTAFRYFLSNRGDKAGVVTVDGDGTHNASDVLKCAEAMLSEDEHKMILGARDFKNARLISRISSRIYAAVFRSASRRYFADPQTSLRVIPTEYLRDCSRIDGLRYEYETNVLLSMPEYNMEYREVAVENSYNKNSRPEHYHPVRDSLMIGMIILKFMASSLFCTLVDLVCFFLFSKYLGIFLGFASITLCTLLARAISSFLNFNINSRTIYKGKKPPKNAILKFYTIAIPQAFLSAFLLQTLSSLFSAHFAAMRTVLKMVVDTTLFFVSYNFQRKWVFKQKSNNK